MQIHSSLRAPFTLRGPDGEAVVIAPELETSVSAEQLEFWSESDKPSGRVFREFVDARAFRVEGAPPSAAAATKKPAPENGKPSPASDEPLELVSKLTVVQARPKIVEFDADELDEAWRDELRRGGPDGPRRTIFAALNARAEALGLDPRPIPKEA